jgi:Skp family chaperone for outer membrane proteins
VGVVGAAIAGLEGSIAALSASALAAFAEFNGLVFAQHVATGTYVNLTKNRLASQINSELRPIKDNVKNLYSYVDKELKKNGRSYFQTI